MLLTGGSCSWESASKSASGPQNQAQRAQSVSPIGLVVNGLHCAASHTHTTSLRCHPHVPTFEPCPVLCRRHCTTQPRVASAHPGVRVRPLGFYAESLGPGLDREAAI